MNKIYLVLFVGANTEVKVHNLYLNQEVALDMGYSLASEAVNDYTAWLVSNPDKQVLDDGTARWVFLETSKQYVGVHELPVSEKTFSPSAHADLLSLTPPVVKLVPQLPDYPIHKDLANKYLGNLPGGFDYSNKPLKLDWVLANPMDAVPTVQLSDKQRTALVVARIKAITDYNFAWNSGLTWTRDHTLFIIANKLEHFQTIIDFECELLDELRENAINNLEEESSSSSEDEW